MSCSSTKDQNPQLTTRGIINPKIIDLISVEDESNSVILSMIEDRPWEETPERVDQLSEKFNVYLDYVIDGWLTNQYPQYLGKKVIFELLGTASNPACSDQAFRQMRDFALRCGITLRMRNEDKYLI